MVRRLMIGGLLCALAWLPARPQAQPAEPQGLQNARLFLERMVRVVGRQAPGSTGETGYGFVVGQIVAPGGATTGLVIVTPDHLVRDPARPTARFAPPSVTFFGDLSHSGTAELQPQRLVPGQGDLAVLVARLTVTGAIPTVPSVSSLAILSGATAWQDGRRGEWQPAVVPGHYVLTETSGWMTFDGLDPSGAAGAAVLTDRGLAGMLVSENPASAGSTRVLSAELIAARVKEWGFPWDLPAADVGSAPLPVQAVARAPVPALVVAPLRLVPLLANEATARTTWTPPGARLSPPPNAGAPLRSSPNKDAQQVGAMPPGTQLPYELWNTGAYDLERKLDNGAWFSVSSGGQPIGYANGNDVYEVWPLPTAPAPATAKIVRDWVPGGGDAHAVLRDAGTHFDLTMSVTCAQDYCDTVQIFTPRPPLQGGIYPGFRLPNIHGEWQQGQSIALHLQLPRAVAEGKTVRLLACVGVGDLCQTQTLLPAS